MYNNLTISTFHKWVVIAKYNKRIWANVTQEIIVNPIRASIYTAALARRTGKKKE